MCNMNFINIQFKIISILFYPALTKMDDDLEFTDDEIRDELSKLGYRSIPSERLQEFKKGKRIQMTSLDYVALV